MRYSPIEQFENSDRITAMIERAAGLEERHYLSGQQQKRLSVADAPVFFDDENCKKFS